MDVFALSPKSWDLAPTSRRGRFVDFYEIEMKHLPPPPNIPVDLPSLQREVDGLLKYVQSSIIFRQIDQLSLITLKFNIVLILPCLDTKEPLAQYFLSCCAHVLSRHGTYTFRKNMNHDPLSGGSHLQGLPSLLRGILHTKTLKPGSNTASHIPGFKARVSSPSRQCIHQSPVSWQFMLWRGHTHPS